MKYDFDIHFFVIYIEFIFSTQESEKVIPQLMYFYVVIFRIYISGIQKVKFVITHNEK
jgi:hypothetical protein